jgi:glycosyltransferase involved in cell wall biosynthesis
LGKGYGNPPRKAAQGRKKTIMKITIFQQAPDIGGSEVFMANLVKEWVMSGDQITAFTNYDELKNLFLNAGAQVNDLPFILDIIGNTRGFIKTLGLLPIAALWYYQTLKSIKNETDVIVMSNFTEKLLVTSLSVKLKIPVVWFEYPPLETLINRNLAIPKYLYRKLSKVPYRIIIYPGSKVPESKEKARANLKAKTYKEKLGIGDKKIIGNISRIAAGKGQEHLIRAFVKVKKSIPDSALLIVGRGPDVYRLKQLAKKLEVENDIHFLGFAKDKNAALLMMDIFVFPATWELEGFGLVITEAMLMQRPIVVVDFGPSSEIIANGKTGILAPSADPKILAQAILTLLRNPKLAKQMGNQALRTAQESFNITKSAKEIRKELLNATRSI